MSFMDSIKDNLSNFDSLQGKYEELKNREAAGNLDDKAKALLDKLRGYFEK